MKKLTYFYEKLRADETTLLLRLDDQTFTSIGNVHVDESDRLLISEDDLTLLIKATGKQFTIGKVISGLPLGLPLKVQTKHETVYYVAFVVDSSTEILRTLLANPVDVRIRHLLDSNCHFLFENVTCTYDARLTTEYTYVGRGLLQKNSN